MYKTFMLALTTIALVGLSSCDRSNTAATLPVNGNLPSQTTASSTATTLPIYEITWNGEIEGTRVSDPVRAVVWGSPNVQERPQFDPAAVLVMGLPAFNSPTQDYRLAVESYGCFPDFPQPRENQFYFTDTRVILQRQGRRSPRQIPVEIQATLLAQNTQREILRGIEAGRNNGVPQVILPTQTCEVVRQPIER